VSILTGEGLSAYSITSNTFCCILPLLFLIAQCYVISRHTTLLPLACMKSVKLVYTLCTGTMGPHENTTLEMLIKYEVFSDWSGGYE